MANEYDAVVIGGGHNGLTCACYLQKAGLKTALLEKYNEVGGMTSTKEVVGPGFHSDTHAYNYQLGHLCPAPEELKLSEHGFELIEKDIQIAHCFPNGESLHMSRNIEDTCSTLSKVSQHDAERWKALFGMWLQVKENVKNAFNSPPGKLSLYIEFLESIPGGMDQYKFDMETLRSFCDANFESDKTKSLLGSFVTHLAKSPDDVGGGSFAWLFDCVLQDYGNKTVKGGMGNLSKALASVFTQAGGEIFTNAGVKRIVTEKNKATHVILENGDTINVKELVASSVDPKALILDMLGEESVGKEITDKLRTYEWGRSNMVIFMALDRPLEYKAGEYVANAPAMHLSEASLDQLSTIAVECNAGLLPTKPFILVHNESATDPSRAPEGMGLIRFIVFNVPYHLRGDARGEIKSTNWDDVKEAFADRVIDMVDREYITNLKDAISARVVDSPVDQERKLSSSVEGTMMHGTMVPYQTGILRPIPEFGGYKSPIENLYLCGSSSHPGAAVSFMPGRNAAKFIIKERGLE